MQTKISIIGRWVKERNPFHDSKDRYGKVVGVVGGFYIIDFRNNSDRSRVRKKGNVRLISDKEALIAILTANELT